MQVRIDPKETSIVREEAVRQDRSLAYIVNLMIRDWDYTMKERIKKRKQASK